MFLISASRRKVVLVWPNGFEEFVRKSQLANRLNAAKAKAKLFGHDSEGRECHKVIAGTVRSVPVSTKFTYLEQVGSDRNIKIHQFKEITLEHEAILSGVLRSVLAPAY